LLADICRMKRNVWRDEYICIYLNKFLIKLLDNKGKINLHFIQSQKGELKYSI